MGFGFYPDGTNQETAEPVHEVEKPIPVKNDQTPEVVPDKPFLKPAPDEALSKQKFVIDSFHNQTALNTGRHAQIIADLKGFAEGSEKEVVYYKQNYSETNSLGIHGDPDVKLDRVHKNALKIHGFKLRMSGSLQYEHARDDGNVNILTGDAVTYPGFHPYKGDKFIMEVEIGRFGEFEVTELPERTSIKSSTYYKIHFQLMHWMDEERQKVLDDAVITEAWFDKQRFLNEPGALLYHTEYVALKFFELQSARMMHYYNSKFLDKNIMFTYMRPDDVYDPYLADFMLKITEYAEAGMLMQQLFRDAPCIETSIWRALLSPTIPLEAVPTSAVIATRKLGSKSVMINSLVNKRYLAWEPDSTSLAEFFEAEDAAAAGGEGDKDPCEDVEPGDLADDSDKLIGDLLLHIHPHYRECILTCCGNCNCCGDVVSDDSNAALAYLLDGSDEFKELIRAFLRYRKINVDQLMKCMKAVYKLPLIQQFYKMPIYIFLARTAVRYIHNCSGIYE